MGIRDPLPRLHGVPTKRRESTPQASGTTVQGQVLSLARRLTATRVLALPPGTYTDPGQAGLQLRVRATRHGPTRTWLLRFKIRGTATQLSLGVYPNLTLEAARALAREYRGLLSQGIDPRDARPTASREPRTQNTAGLANAHSVDFLVQEFLQRYILPSGRNVAWIERMLDKDILPAWSGRDARTIRAREVIEVLDRIVERGSPIMANRVAAVLGQLFRFGIHRAIVADSPVKLLMRPGGKEKSRNRALSDQELRILVSDPQAGTRYSGLSHVLLLLLLTGQRRGELALARWREIDFDAAAWRIPDENAKTRGHVVPLSGWALREFAILKRRARNAPWVLPSKQRNGPVDAKLLTRGIARCQQRFRELGIAPFTLHDLRRTCRTGMARLGIPPHIAERVLNHAQPKIPGTYDVHDYLEEKRAALDQWAAKQGSREPRPEGTAGCDAESPRAPNAVPPPRSGRSAVTT
jgi:integrase